MHLHKSFNFIGFSISEVKKTDSFPALFIIDFTALALNEQFLNAFGKSYALKFIEMCLHLC